MIRPRELSSSLSLFPARTPTLPPATHTNSYALGGRDVLLVEPATPYEDEQRAWLEWARGVSSSGRNVIAIVATHHHEDHVGGLDVLAKELSVPVWAHELTVQRLAPETRLHVTRRLVDGDVIVLTGPRDESWRVLHTPGHAPGHVCLFEERSRSLIVGDMVASVGTILIAPGDGDMTTYIEQLRRLLELKASLVLPAHGEPIDDASDVFTKYIQHRLAREAKVLAAVRAVGSTGADVATLVPEAYSDTPVHLWPIAAMSLEMHLQKLERDGAIVRVDLSGAPARGQARAPAFRVV